MVQSVVESQSKPIFGYSFSGLRSEQVASLASRLPESGQGLRLLVTANLDHIVLLRKNRQLAAAYDSAWLRTIDGAPVFLYSRMRGANVQERVTGADLFPQLMERFEAGTHRLFFVVPNEEVADGIRQWAAGRGFSPAEIGIEIPPFGFEKDHDYGESLRSKIVGMKTTHLFFGVGCPRSEGWMTRHADRLGDVYGFAVGAAIGFFTGTFSRAPAFMRHVGLEWAWRVGLEPRRLARRYFINSWEFLLAIKDDAVRSREAGANARSAVSQDKGGRSGAGVLVETSPSNG